MLQVFAAYLEDALVGVLRVHPDGHCHGCTLCFGSAAASARPLTWRYFRLRFHAYQAAAIVVTYARSSARKQGPGALLTAAGCVFVSPLASTRHILGGQHGPDAASRYADTGWRQRHARHLLEQSWAPSHRLTDADRLTRGWRSLTGDSRTCARLADACMCLGSGLRVGGAAAAQLAERGRQAHSSSSGSQPSRRGFARKQAS